MGKQYGFHHDTERCIKCYACEIACLQWHGIPAGTVKLRRITEEVIGNFPDVKRIFHSETCHHCADAPCLNACPTAAITKREEDGIVVVDSSKCTGCHACFEACPFSIPEFDKEDIMRKCDMCLDRLADGKNPICSDACPTQALRWGLLTEIQT